MRSESLSALRIVVFAILTFATPALAEAPYSAAAVWDFDSINPVHPTDNARQIAAREVYNTMVQMLDRWNAHDIEGYLDAFWRSPALLVVEDGAVLNGWQEMHDRFVRGFNNRNTMGHGTGTRVQVRMLGPDAALALEHWTIAFPNSSHVVVGIDTSYLQRIDGAWKVTISHSSYLDM